MPKTKLDKDLSKSIISRRYADASAATKEDLRQSESLEDSSGQIHSITHCVTLRCAINNAAHTFSERFYVSDNCVEFDALLRKGIKG
jgi:hypothetical protein